MFPFFKKKKEIIFLQSSSPSLPFCWCSTRCIFMCSQCWQAVMLSDWLVTGNYAVFNCWTGLHWVTVDW